MDSTSKHNPWNITLKQEHHFAFGRWWKTWLQFLRWITQLYAGVIYYLRVSKPCLQTCVYEGQEWVDNPIIYDRLIKLVDTTGTCAFCALCSLIDFCIQFIDGLCY